MWYEQRYRRHLLDMHIEDWNEEFLSQFSPETYLENLKRAKVQNAMLYFQSHVGYCYYPTASGHMHQAFVGREDAMRRLCEMCRQEGIAVTGYYSLIYNNWAHNTHPQWRMLTQHGMSRYEQNVDLSLPFADPNGCRYGMCCPNNMEYREFVKTQIREMLDYFTVDGMFYDMLYWSHFCYCDSCKKRWEEEVGGPLPQVEDWHDPKWLLHVQKRREWMGEFAQFVTNFTKELNPALSVEHNFASGVLPGWNQCAAEPVNAACDFTGGDLYGGIYSQSFSCKFYRAISRHQPFEYMFSRCEPNLSSHTVTKSLDVMRSSTFLTSAHHGATLVIDAIDPVGTMDQRVYDRIGTVFSQTAPYEPYFQGDLIQDVGVYYSLHSKFPLPGPANHPCAVGTVKTMITHHIPVGVTGTFQPFDCLQLLCASQLTGEDAEDFPRIIEYVEKGGTLYFSGGECEMLLQTFFGAHMTSYTEYTRVYASPSPKGEALMDPFTSKYPIPMDCSAPLIEGISPEAVIATLTLPYTLPKLQHFASIHSNPPGVSTSHPILAETSYGKGHVIWSALPFEAIDSYLYQELIARLALSHITPTVISDAPANVELITFRDKGCLRLSAVHLNEAYYASKVPAFSIQVRTQQPPKSVRLLPGGEAVSFTFQDGMTQFSVPSLDMFAMYEIQL